MTKYRCHGPAFGERAGAETDVAGWRTLAEDEIRAEFGIPSGTGRYPYRRRFAAVIRDCRNASLTVGDPAAR